MKRLIVKIGFAACLGATLVATVMIGVTMLRAGTESSNALSLGVGVSIVCVSSLCLGALATKMDD